jgi:hypothetical protein
MFLSVSAGQQREASWFRDGFFCVEFFSCRHCERKRSNPWRPQQRRWIASSQVLLAMTTASSLRTQGPITTGGSDRASCRSFFLSNNIRHGVWVPAFAGTTSVKPSLRAQRSIYRTAQAVWIASSQVLLAGTTSSNLSHTPARKSRAPGSESPAPVPSGTPDSGSASGRRVFPSPARSWRCGRSGGSHEN